MSTMDVDQEPAANNLTSTPPNATTENKAKGVSADDNREAFSPELLRIYYDRLFPYEQVRARGTVVFLLCVGVVLVVWVVVC